jgi:tetratricopeptide (TPR) repeat protein
MKEKTSKTLQRALTLILGIGFAGSTLAITLSSIFSQNKNNTVSNSNAPAPNDAAALEKQVKLQASGYEKVLEREPNNLTALNGLARIYLQTGNVEKAIPPLEKLVKFYPEQKEFVSILQIIKQQQKQKPKSQPDKPTGN